MDLVIEGYVNAVTKGRLVALSWTTAFLSQWIVVKNLLRNICSVICCFSLFKTDSS